MILNMLDTAFGDADVRHDQNVQHQVGDNDERHTQTGRHSQITNNVDFNKHQREEANSIRNQRQHARNVKSPERQTC